MTRSFIETKHFINGIVRYSVIDTKFNTLVIYTTSSILAKHIATKVDVCNHETPFVIT
jgi:hypothetical protein